MPGGEVRLFSRERFRQLRRRLDEDLEQLEGLMGRRIAAWDLSRGACWQDAAAAQPVYLRDNVIQRRL